MIPIIFAVVIFPLCDCALSAETSFASSARGSTIAAVTTSENPVSALMRSIATASAGDVITLQPIVFSIASEIQINKNMTLVSPSSLSVLDCQNRCIHIFGGASVTIIGLTLKNGDPSTSPNFKRSGSLRSDKSHKALPSRRGQESKSRVVLRISISLNQQGDLSVVYKSREKQNRKPRAFVPIRESASPIVGGCLWVQQSSIILRDVTMTGCRAQMGGALGVQDSTVAVSNTRFFANGFIDPTSNLEGGGAYFSNSSVNLFNVTASGNFLNGSNVSGGGFYFYLSSVSVTNSHAVNNEIIGEQFGSGGGSSFITCDVIMSGTITSGNTVQFSMAAGRGGGFFFYSCALIISSCTASNNKIVSSSSAPALGAGFSLFYCNAAAITKSEAVGNVIEYSGSSYAYGGGFHFTGSENLTISLTTAASNNIIYFSGSTAFGGGFSFYGCVGAVLSQTAAINNLIQNSQSSAGYGGGYYFFLSTSLSLSSSLAKGNEIQSTDRASARGGGIALYSSFDAIVSLFSAEENILTSSEGATGAGYFFDKSENPTVISSTASKNVVQLSGGYGTGGGFSFYSSELTKIKYSSAIGNVIYSNSTGPIQGGGFFFTTCSTVSVSFSTAIGNVLSGIDTMGGGFMFGTTQMVTLANCTIESNTLQSFFSPTLNASVYQPPPENYDGCSAGPVIITETSGTLTEGSIGPYINGNICMWVFQPAFDSVSSTIYHLVFQFTQLDTRNEIDTVYFYDGLSSSSPLIGGYSGDLEEFSCLGPCPSAVFIETSRPEMMLVFDTTASVSNANNQYDGWALEWRVEAIYNQMGSVSTLPILLSHPSASGGGIFCSLGRVQVLGCNISHNVLSHNILALGGGIYSQNSGTLENLYFNNNSVVGNVAGGGAFYVSQGQYTATNSLFRDNSATARGWCFTTSADRAVQCPASFGGAVAIAYGSRWRSDSSHFIANFVSCENSLAICSANGAAISVAGTAAFYTSNCVENFVQCDRDGCVRGGGGCLHGTDSGATFVTGFEFARNRILGIVGGGGVMVEGKHTTRIAMSSITDNSAREGGAIWVDGQASLMLMQCVITRNVGDSLGGAISTSGAVKVGIMNSVLLNNIAPRIPSVLSYNNDNAATYVFYNSSFLDRLGDGTAALLIGQIDFQNNLWESSKPGTIFRVDQSSDFFSISYSSCSDNTYALLPASTVHAQELQKCLACPFGSICRGSNATTNGLRAQRDYHGVRTDLHVDFFPCPTGFCCDESDGCEYDYCSGSRVGLLCGACPVNMGLQFFSESCVTIEECDDARWALPVIFLVAVGIVGYLLWTTPNPNSGMISVLLFFYQALPLVKSTRWSEVGGDVMTGLTSVFSLSPSSGQSGGFGICLLPSMTPEQKLGTRILFLILVLVTFAIVYFGHLALHRFSFPWFRRRAPSSVAYLGALVRFITIAFTTLILVPLQLIQCIRVFDRRIWWYNGDVECYEPGWQKAAIAVALTLTPLPFVCIILLVRWETEDGLMGWQREIRRVLSSGYTPARRWWLGVSLLRRLTLVVMFTNIEDQSWKAVACSILCFFFVILNLRLHPFELQLTHTSETISLALLAVLAASTSPALTRIQFGVERQMSHFEEMEWLQFVCAIFPVVGCAALGIKVAARRVASARGRKILVVAGRAGAGEELGCGCPLSDGADEEEWENLAVSRTMCVRCQYC